MQTGPVQTGAMSSSWAFVRQMIFATAELVADSEALSSAYGLPPGFTDPMLLDFGIADETIPIGPEQYIELLSPAGDDSPLHAWLDKRGVGGYGVAVQVPDMTAIRERAMAAGVSIVIEQEALGHRIMQLNPRRMGMLLDLDEVPDRTRWFWDDITPGPAADARVDALAEIEIGVAEPETTAALWAHLLDVDQPTATTVDLGTIVSFLTAEHAGVLALTLRTAEELPDRSLLGVTFRHRTE